MCLKMNEFKPLKIASFIASQMEIFSMLNYNNSFPARRQHFATSWPKQGIKSAQKHTPSYERTDRLSDEDIVKPT